MALIAFEFSALVIFINFQRILLNFKVRLEMSVVNEFQRNSKKFIQRSFLTEKLAQKPYFSSVHTWRTLTTFWDRCVYLGIGLLLR